MKVFIHFEDCLEDDDRMTVKLTLPKKWRSGPAQQLVDTFVQSYNKKHPGEGALDVAQVHMEKRDGFVVPMDAPVNSFMESGADLFVKAGAGQSMDALGFVPPKPAEGDSASTSASASTKAKAKAASDKPTSSVSAMARARAAADAQLASSSSSSSSSSSAAAAGEAGPAKSKCTRFGCDTRFRPEDNVDGGCRFHAKPPIFHETRKYWACCPDKVGWDWDTFMEIPGCCVGKHSTEAQGKQKFLGGTDVRAEKHGVADQSIPQKLDTALDKLSSLRKALLGVGVSGAAFDAARDRVKAAHEKDADVKPEELWSKVAELVGQHLDASLSQLGA